MTWTFDTGRTTPQRYEILSAVIAALQPLRTHDDDGIAQAEGFLQAVLPFGGVVRSPQDDIGIDQLWTTFNGAEPAVAVGLGDKRVRAVGMAGHSTPRHEGELEVIVYVINRNASTLLARVNGDTTDAGIWHTLERIEELLIGLEITMATLAPGSETPSTLTYTRKPGKDIKRLLPRLEEELATTNELTLWRQLYSVDVSRSVNHNRAATDRLKSIASAVKTTDDVPGTIDAITTLVDE